MVKPMVKRCATGRMPLQWPRGWQRKDDGRDDYGGRRDGVEADEFSWRRGKRRRASLDLAEEGHRTSRAWISRRTGRGRRIGEMAREAGMRDGVVKPCEGEADDARW
nr:unnamed protein product [Digitaria exilis]